MRNGTDTKKLNNFLIQTFSGETHFICYKRQRKSLPLSTQFILKKIKNFLMHEIREMISR